MTKEQFYTWLENPASMNEDSIVQLKEIVERFPYFAAAQMMLAKNLKQENHIDQQKHLQKAAIMAPNRQVFKSYLFDKKKPHLHETPKVAAEVEEVMEASPLEVVKDDVIEQTSKIEDANKESEEGKDEELGGPRFPDELIPEPVLYQIETSDLPEIHSEEQAAEAEPAKMSFADWLQYAKQGKPSVRVSDMPTATNAKPKDNIELIDHFLTQQEEKPKKRAEFYNPHKNAAKSNADDFTVISETLAKIYFEQEKYELAKQAYEALNLKYPEKSVYFAARLKAIDEKLNPEE